MASATPLNVLTGKTIRWTFDDGPVAGKTFEHIFDKDGTISWRLVDGATKGKPQRAATGTALSFGDSLAVVSYRSAEGYTLTVLLNFDDMRMVGFGSNSEVWTQQQGSFVITTPEESS
ncbi:MAG TPA: hypothetical protein VJ598_10325 [Albitalea sp.]|nr:hypothetical protein [Albitalea sp.]